MPTRKPQHSYLTETERRQLDVLVRRAARSLPAAQCNLLLQHFEHHLADLQHARAVAGGLRRDVNTLRLRADNAVNEVEQARRELASAEDELAEWRNGQHAEQAQYPLEDELFDNALGEWPPLDTQDHLFRRGRWMPVEDAPAIDSYQPAHATAPGQN